MQLDNEIWTLENGSKERLRLEYLKAKSEDYPVYYEMRGWGGGNGPEMERAMPMFDMDDDMMWEEDDEMEEAMAFDFDEAPPMAPGGEIGGMGGNDIKYKDAGLE